MKSIFNKILILLLVLALCLSVCGCGETPKPPQTSILDARVENPPATDEAAILYEMRACFDFFWNEAQTDKSSPAYGLIADRYPNGGNMASIASVGFGLPAIVIGVERGWITRSEGSERVLGTLNTFKKLEQVNGFFYHFIDMSTAKHSSGSEVSVIDTAIFIFGALTAGEYFGGECETLANELYERVNWKWYTGLNGGKPQFRMSYNPSNDSFAGFWDWYAEQLMLYVLGAGAPNPEFRTDISLYNGFTKKEGAFGKNVYIYSWFGSLFTYQYSHAFIGFEGIADADGVDWFDNSTRASVAAYDYCVKRSNTVKTYSETSWGLTACDTRKGYSGILGTPPRGYGGGEEFNAIMGTVAPSAALGSIVFTPTESIAALRYYQQFEALSCKYGLVDAYDLEYEWAAKTVIGIDKGITLLMMENYLTGGIWALTDGIKYIQDGLARLGFTEKAR